MAIAIPRNEARSYERLRHHYEVEKELAGRLRAAPGGERLHMLTRLYEELFKRVPDHPRLARKQRPEESRRAVTQRMRLLRRFLQPQTSFLEIGPGDCALSFEVARSVRSVHGVDVDVMLTRNPQAPANFRLLLSDGVSVPVPAGSVDLAYSDQLMEHLHPDDARQQVRNIFAAIAPGGIYVCLTPNRLNGPHDISRYFAEEADGFHLKEYTLTELDALFRAAGFRRIAIYAKTKGMWFPVPLGLIRALEDALQRIHPRLRFAAADRWPLKQLLNGAVVATK